jgi:hypothetical protein
LAIVAGVAEARRTTSGTGSTTIGWVPWRGIQVVAVFTLIAALFLALKLG